MFFVANVVHPVAPVTLIEMVRSVRQFDRELGRSLARIRVRARTFGSAFEAVSELPSATVERRPVDVAHWLPNMPRGSEDQRRGGVRSTNAGGELDRRSQQLPLQTTGVLDGRPSCI